MFLVAYYDKLISQFRGHREKSVLNHNGEVVNPLCRYEFHSAENQRFIGCHNFSEEPVTYNKSDFVYEDRRLTKIAD